MDVPKRIELPSGDGAYVEFKSLDEMTGADVHRLRANVDRESFGGTQNGMMRTGMEIGIRTWHVPYLSDERTPQANPKAYLALRWRDLKAIEHEIDKLILPLLSDAEAPSIDNTEPGSPTRLGSE